MGDWTMREALEKLLAAREEIWSIGEMETDVE